MNPMEHLLIIQPVLLGVPGEGALELGEVVVGRLADDVAVELREALLVLTQGVGAVQALLHLQVCLPGLD